MVSVRSSGERQSSKTAWEMIGPSAETSERWSNERAEAQSKAGAPQEDLWSGAVPRKK